MAADESDLMARCKAGDSTARTALYAAHAARIKAFFLRSGFPTAQADALTQETLERAVRYAARFDPAATRFNTWLADIARSVLHDVGATPAGEFDPALADEMFTGDEKRGGLRTAGLREEQDAVTQCIDALPPELARTIHLRYVQGRTARGIAAITGAAEEEVRDRLSEAARMVAECLRAKGFLE